MDPEEKTNGAGVTARQIDTVILTYDRELDRLDIGGHAASIDLMLDMLYRARRALEFQVRKTQALEIQAAAQEAAQNRAVAEALRKGR